MPSFTCEKSTLAMSHSCAGCRFQIFFLLAPQISLVLSFLKWCNCNILRIGFFDETRVAISLRECR